MTLILFIAFILLFCGGGAIFNEGAYSRQGYGIGVILFAVLIYLALTGHLG